MARKRDPWAVDKRLPLATLAALVVQTASLVWWASQLASTVDEHGRVLAEVRLYGAPVTRDRLAALEAAATSYKDGVARIDTRLNVLDGKIDRLFEGSQRRPTRP